MFSVADASPVDMFSAVGMPRWVYELCPRHGDGNQCPMGSFISNVYVGARLQVVPGDTLMIRVVYQLPIFTLPIDPVSVINPNAPMDEIAREFGVRQRSVEDTVRAMVAH